MLCLLYVEPVGLLLGVGPDLHLQGPQAPQVLRRLLRGAQLHGLSPSRHHVAAFGQQQLAVVTQELKLCCTARLPDWPLEVAWRGEEEMPLGAGKRAVGKVNVIFRTAF